jgi:hypothetical protein
MTTDPQKGGPTMTDNDPITPAPRIATPEEAAEAARKHDFTPEETAAAIKRVQEKEEEQGRRLFGDGPRFVIPDTDTDS